MRLNDARPLVLNRSLIFDCSAFQLLTDRPYLTSLLFDHSVLKDVRPSLVPFGHTQVFHYSSVCPLHPAYNLVVTACHHLLNPATTVKLPITVCLHQHPYSTFTTNVTVTFFDLPVHRDHFATSDLHSPSPILFPLNTYHPHQTRLNLQHHHLCIFISNTTTTTKKPSDALPHHGYTLLPPTTTNTSYRRDFTVILTATIIFRGRRGSGETRDNTPRTGEGHLIERGKPATKKTQGLTKINQPSRGK
ncbi:hypothetical protein LR48_Vigan10g175100 [Vigna angularis]|uniref:Uncharacterized protein n=1 Tax=Phaseolus angularis TaxID=3914 RepID=A0A0L9VM86_PHAAN|nr:hypothetical protein LR48_Vigan10g175100 [Vigna angularis]